jgi:hypothetical protein
LPRLELLATERYDVLAAATLRAEALARRKEV